MKHIIKILIAIAIVYVGNRLYDANTGASGQQKLIEKLSNLCENGESIQAKVDQQYLENTYGNKIEIKIYEYYIEYQYKNKVYREKITSNLKPKSTEKNISILKTNPKEFISGNACNQLETQKNSLKSSTLENTGIVMTIIGIILLISFIKSLFTKKQS